MDATTTHTSLLQFSTEGLRPQDLMPVLREVVCRVHLRADFIPVNELPPRVAFKQFNCGRVKLLSVDSDGFVLDRRPEFLSDGDGDFRFVLPEGTPFQYENGSTEERMNSGEAMLVFNGAAGTVRLFGSSLVKTMRISHQLLVDAVPGLQLQPMWRIRPDSQAVRLLGGYLECLRRQWPSEDRLLDGCVERHLVHLVALALNPTEATHEVTGSRAVRAARLATIRADVLMNLNQPQLTAKSVAQRHGVTDRYIHRLFEETGETFGTFVERERTRRAFALLTDPAKSDMRIIDIALAVGYTEHSTFNRAFRRSFGDSPRAIRIGHRRQDERPN
jgi:AraC-like DNA-binding protein